MILAVVIIGVIVVLGTLAILAEVLVEIRQRAELAELDAIDPPLPARRTEDPE